MGASGTNRKAIMVQRVAGQVQGNANFLWKMFWSGKVCEVTGMAGGDIWKLFHWLLVKVVKYDHVSE